MLVSIVLIALGAILLISWLTAGGEWRVTEPWLRESEREAGFWYGFTAISVTLVLALPGGWMLLMGLFQIVGGWLTRNAEIKIAGAKLIALGLLPLGAAAFFREYLLPRLWARFFDE